MPFKDPEKRKEYEQREDVKEKRKEGSRKYREANREKIAERKRKYYQENREEIIKKSIERNKKPEVKEKKREIQKKYYDNNKEKIAEYHQKWGKEYNQRPDIKEKNRLYNQSPERKKYLWEKKGIRGMTVDKFNNMYKEQQGRCSICGRHQSEFKFKLSVDHCHKTEKIRGLLCHFCNKALGMFCDDVEVLYSAIFYLEKHKGEENV
jgi:hypothetical protein